MAKHNKNIKKNKEAAVYQDFTMNKKYNFMQYSIIFTVSFLVYFNTYFNKFALDDTMVLTENKYTKNGIDGIKKIFTSDAFEGFLGENKNLLPGGRYRPLSQMVLAIEYEFFKLNAAPYHLINIVLYGILMLLLFFLLKKLFEGILNSNKFLSLPFLVTLIYAVHPIHTEVVANIKSLDLLLAMLFSFLSIYHSILFYEDGKKIRLIYIYIFLLFGIFSKENVITLLAAIPLLILYFRYNYKPLTNKEKRQIKPLLFIILTLVLSIISYFILRIIMLGSLPEVEVTELLNNPFLEASSFQRLATVIYTWFVYFKLMILPVNLTHDYYPYVFGLKDFTDPIVLLSLLILLFAGFYSIKNLINTIKGKSNFNVFAFGFMFFFIIFSASSNLIVNIGAFMNERFVFIADLGLIIAFVWFIIEYLPKKNENIKKPILGILGIILLLFSIKTIHRNKVWYDDYTLFTTDVIVSANSAKCTVSAGGKSYEKALIESDNIKKRELLTNAVNYLNKGISIHPKYFQAYWLLGNVYLELNEFEKSLQTYSTALRIAKNQDVLQNIRNLAIKAKQNRDFKTSMAAYTYINSQSFEVNNTIQIADNLVELKKTDSAIALLLQTIKIDSLCDECYNKLGEIYGKALNRFEISRIYLLKGYEIDPKNASILENLGVLNGMIEHYQESINFLTKALEIKPNDKNLLKNIILSYKNMKDLKNMQKYEKILNSIP